MDITLFEVHLDDIAVAVGDREPSTDPADATESADTDDDRGVPRAVFLLVPVFVVLGVAAGFLAARRFADRSASLDESVGIAIETETGTEPQ